MAGELPPPYVIEIRPCTIHAGRFRWDVLEFGKPVQSSADSFATEAEAQANGAIAVEKLSAIWRGSGTPTET